MYRGTRLAASFLLFLTGSATAALAIGVLPGAIGSTGLWIVVPLAVAFGVSHFAALVGVARGTSWGRSLGISVAESGGGLAFASIAAILLGADALSAGDVRTALGFSAWMLAMYGLLGVAVGRMRLIGWSRRSNWWPAPLLRVAG
jgi:hypothetical protein